MEAAVFEARVKDTARLCDLTGAPKFLGFLSPSEAASADRLLNNNGRIEYAFFGGYAEAERTMLVCMPEWCDAPVYPISAVTFKYRKADSLSHRDFLGALMNIGLVREAVGDILIEPGRAVVFIKSDISKFIISQINRIGKTGVEAKEGFDKPLPAPGELLICKTTVASARLDCVVAALCDTSRSRAAELITGGLTSVNSLCCDKLTHTVSSGNRITVRGKGRFDIISADAYSRKGRIILEYGKYI